jgi:hypothetical protein
MYSTAFTPDGQTVVVLAGQILSVIRIAGFHILTAERIEKLLLLK